jgi:hypothetical protein
LTSFRTAFAAQTPAILRTRDQRAHVERRLSCRADPNVAAALCESLDDRSLADAGITDEHRVVLRLARQDLDHAPDLAVAADDRVEPVGPRVGDEVAAVLLERLVRALRHRRRNPLISTNGGQGLKEPVAGETVLAQQATGSGAAALVE